LDAGARAVALTLADLLQPQLLGVGAELDGAGLTLGIEDGGLLASLRGEDGGLLLAVGAGDGGLAVPVGLRDRRTTVTLGAHLGVHGGDDLGGRVNPLDLD